MKIAYLFVSLVALLTLVACEEAQVTDQPTPTATVVPNVTATLTVSPATTATIFPPTATATQGFAMLKPPPAMLTIDGKEQTSGIGTYCWMAGKGGICADYFGIVTPKTPLVIQSPASAMLRLPLTQAPSKVFLKAIPVTNADEMKENPPADGRIWRAQHLDGQEFSAALSAEQKIELMLKPGIYILHLTAVWEGYGDVSYGFLVEVK